LQELTIEDLSKLFFGDPEDENNNFFVQKPPYDMSWKSNSEFTIKKNWKKICSITMNNSNKNTLNPNNFGSEISIDHIEFNSPGLESDGHTYRIDDSKYSKKDRYLQRDYHKTKEDKYIYDEEEIIFNMDWRLLYKKEISKEIENWYQLTFENKNYENGIYFIRIENRELDPIERLLSFNETKIYNFNSTQDKYLWSYYEENMDTGEINKMLYRWLPNNIGQSIIFQKYEDYDWSWTEYFKLVTDNINWNPEILTVFLEFVGEPSRKYKEERKEFRNYAIELLWINETINQIKEYRGTDLNIYTQDYKINMNKQVEKLNAWEDIEFGEADILTLYEVINNLYIEAQKYPPEYHKKVGLDDINIAEIYTWTWGLANPNYYKYGFKFLFMWEQVRLNIRSWGFRENLAKINWYDIQETSQIIIPSGTSIFHHEYWHIANFFVNMNQKEWCDLTWTKTDDYEKLRNWYKEDDEDEKEYPIWFITEYAKVNYEEDIAETIEHLQTSPESYKYLFYKAYKESGNIPDEDRISDYEKDNAEKIKEIQEWESDILLKKINICKTMIYYLSDGLMDDEYRNDVLSGEIINAEYREWKERADTNPSFYSDEFISLLEESDLFYYIENIYPNPYNQHSNDALKIQGETPSIWNNIKFKTINFHDTSWKVIQSVKKENLRLTTWKKWESLIEIIPWTLNLKTGIYLISFWDKTKRIIRWSTNKIAIE